MPSEPLVAPAAGPGTQEVLYHEGGTVGSWCLTVDWDGLTCSDGSLRLRVSLDRTLAWVLHTHPHTRTQILNVGDSSMDISTTPAAPSCILCPSAFLAHDSEQVTHPSLLEGESLPLSSVELHLTRSRDLTIQSVQSFEKLLINII